MSSPELYAFQKIETLKRTKTKVLHPDVLGNHTPGPPQGQQKPVPCRNIDISSWIFRRSLLPEFGATPLFPPRIARAAVGDGRGTIARSQQVSWHSDAGGGRIVYFNSIKVKRRSHVTSLLR